MIKQCNNVYLGLTDYPTLFPALILSWQPRMSILATHMAFKYARILPTVIEEGRKDKLLIGRYVLVWIGYYVYSRNHLHL